LYKNLTVLCVEDECGVRKRIVNTLKYYFKDVYEAKDGEIGLEVYYKKSPNLIICDIKMPNMDGISMVKEIRKDDLFTPIIFLTAHNKEQYLMELLNLKIQHFILKPISTKALEEGIQNALKGRFSGVIQIKENVFLDIDNLELNVGYEKISLSLREAKFLTLLARGSVVRYSIIEDMLWEQKSMSQSALKSFIRDLRKKLPFDLIENVPQVGYKLLDS